MTPRAPADFPGLPGITFRQLEVFCFVCHEGSYANAALELRSTRANIKRVCEDFENAVGRPLFEEGENRSLIPTLFAQGLLGQVPPLSRTLRKLEENVRSQHAKGRILRFAAAGEFFKGGLFTEFLDRLQISDTFRPCFLRIESKRFRPALLNAECDIYLGVGIQPCDRLDLVDLGKVPWEIRAGKKMAKRKPAKPADLPAGKWRITSPGEPEDAAALLEEFHTAGAREGRITLEGESSDPADDEIVFLHRPTMGVQNDDNAAWPSFHLSAVLRKHHPYSELLPRLKGAAFA